MIRPLALSVVLVSLIGWASPVKGQSGRRSVRLRMRPSTTIHFIESSRSEGLGSRRCKRRSRGRLWSIDLE